MVSRIAKNKEKIPLFLYSIIIIMLGVGLAASISGYYYIKNIFIKHQISTLRDSLMVTSGSLTHYIQDCMQKSRIIASSGKAIALLTQHKNGEDQKSVTSSQLSPITHAKYILFSQDKKQVWSSDGSTTFAQNKTLLTCLETARILFEPSLSDFIDIPGSNEKKLFVCTPVMDGKTYIGSVAMELDNGDFLNIVAQEYERIGKTGDIVIGKAADTATGEKTKDKAIIVFPTRFDSKAAFNTTISFDDSKSVPIQRAVRGGHGDGTGIDFNNINSIFTWDYMPVTGWGIVVKQSVQEINDSLFSIWLSALAIFIVCFISICFFMYLIWRNTKGRAALCSACLKRIPYAALYLLFIGNLLLFMNSFNYYYNRVLLQEKKNDTTISISLQHAAQRVNYIVSSLERMAHTIALDIRNKHIPLTQVTSLVQADMKKNPFMQTLYVAIKNNSQWDGLSLSMHNGQIIQSIVSVNNNLEWFAHALSESASWILLNNNNHDADFIYTVPMTSNDSISTEQITIVVAISCPQTLFMKGIKSSLENFIRYFIMNFEGTVIYQEPGAILPSHTLNPWEQKNSNLWFAKIPSLRWHIGCISKLRSPYWRFVLPFLFHIIMALLNIILIIYVFFVATKSQGEKNKKPSFLLIMTGIVLALTLLIYFL